MLESRYCWSSAGFAGDAYRVCVSKNSFLPSFLPPTPTTRAPSVLGVCGWVSAPRTALPRVYRPLVCSLGVSALPRPVVRRTTMPWSSPQRPQHAPYVRAEGARVDHTAPTLYPPPTDPRSPRRANPLSRKRSLHPCTPASRRDMPPAPTPRMPLGTTTRARCTPGGPGVAARSVATAHGPKDTA